MSRESSATTTRCVVAWTAAPPVSARPRPREVVGAGAGEEAVGVEQDHEAVARSWRSPRSTRAPAAGTASSWSMRDRQDLLDVVDDDAGLPVPVSTMTILPGSAPSVASRAGGEVADRDDLAAQPDDAADPGASEATERGSV